MSFGRRSVAGNPSSGPAPQLQATVNADEEHVHPAIAYGIIGAAAAVFLGSAIWFCGPYTYSASPVHVSMQELGESTMYAVMSEEHRRDFERRSSADFSLILRPVGEQHSAAMQKVAERCLPRSFRRLALPKEVHRAYSQASDYLVCAMTTNVERLCDPAERQHLVAQLLQYKDRRQNVLGFERALEAFFSDPRMMAGASMSRSMAGASGQELPPVTMPVSGVIDARVGRTLATLNRSGHLTAWDFSRFGLFLPAEYARYLERDKAGKAAC